VMAHSKKKGTLYMTSGSGTSILVASLELDVRVWYQRLRHMSEKEMKVLLSKNAVGIEIYRLKFM